MKKQIFIHIGFGKTGTSAIQEYLFFNRRKNSYYYPKIGLKNKAHHNLATLNQGSFSKQHRQLYAKLVKDISKCDAETKIIISSENFCFTRPDYIRDIYYYLQSFDVRVVFYIRNQVDLIQSSYLQMQKIGLDYGESIEHFFEIYAQSFNFMERINPWTEYFGTENIITRLYDERVTGVDVCKDFLNLIGIKFNQLPAINSHINQSLSPEFSDIIALIDKRKSSPRQRKKHIDYFLKLSKQLRGLSHVSLIQSELQENIREYYLESNTEFAKHFLDDQQEKYLLDSP